MLSTTAYNHSSEIAADPPCRFTRRNSQAASKTGTEEDFRSQIARYRKRCFWSGGGYRFSGCAWAKQKVNVVTIVAWAGVGKSTLVNHWLRRMAAEHYRSAELVFGWSFYRQGTGGGTSSADEFLDAALTWFGDPDPHIGTAWEKGERLAKLIAHRRSLLILDGLEPLQNPPGPQEGRLREPSLQALLRELAAFNTGLSVITTRIRLLISQITSAPQPYVVTWNNYPAMLERAARALGVKGWVGIAKCQRRVQWPLSCANATGQLSNRCL